MWYHIFGFEMAFHPTLHSMTVIVQWHSDAQASFTVLVSEMKLCCLLSSTKFPCTAVEFMTRLPH